MLLVLRKPCVLIRHVNFSGFQNPAGFGIPEPKSRGIRDGIRDCHDCLKSQSFGINCVVKDVSMKYQRAVLFGGMPFVIKTEKSLQ